MSKELRGQGAGLQHCRKVVPIGRIHSARASSAQKLDCVLEGILLNTSEEIVTLEVEEWRRKSKGKKKSREEQSLER